VVQRTSPGGQLLDRPARILFDPVVTAALRVAVAQAGPAAGLVGDVVLEIAAGRRSAAAGSGTRGVPDLGQVPQHDPRIMAPGLVPVVTILAGQRLDLDQQVPLPGDPGAEPPCPVSSRRTRTVGGGEGERWPAGRVGPARRVRFVPLTTAVGRCGPGAAVPDGVPLAVGDGHAPGRARVAGRGRGQVPGQVRVDMAIPPISLG
jgi:hypothetical protein